MIDGRRLSRPFAMLGLLLRYTLTCTILCFVLVLGKIKTKLFLVLQWYFDLSKQKVFVLVFVLTKPKRNRAGQVIHDQKAPKPFQTSDGSVEGDHLQMVREHRQDRALLAAHTSSRLSCR